MAMKCNQAGCKHSRTAYSVFCEEHHQAQLKRAGLITDAPTDQSNELVRGCERLLGSFARNAITMDELCSNLFDRFVHMAVKVGTEKWPLGFKTLPRAIAIELLAYAKSHRELRTFQPRPPVPQQRAAEDRVTLAAQTELITRLEREIS